MFLGEKNFKSLSLSVTSIFTELFSVFQSWKYISHQYLKAEVGPELS